MRCHYEVMGLPRDANSEDIKKKYKKLALQWHPDRNHGQEEEATAVFKEISTAYSVLSDLQERKWYDDHRESILRGGSGASDGNEESDLINLWQYFNSSCYSSFDDGVSSFFTVYRKTFESLVEQEKLMSNGKTIQYPTFGSSTSTPDEVLAFYNQWENYVSDMTFAWADQYNTLEAPNRQVKRAMEKENAKCRESARKEWIAQVRSLVAFVKKRDTRYIAIEVERSNKKKEEELRKAQKKADDQRKRQELREQWRNNYKQDEAEEERRLEERKAAFLLADDEEDDEDYHGSQRKMVNALDDEDIEGLQTNAMSLQSIEENAPTQEREDASTTEPSVSDSTGAFHCEVCSKYFKTEAQLNQHTASKVHRKKVTESQRKGKSK